MRPAFAGLERADSVSIDAHKWLYLPKACGIVLVRRGKDLLDVFAHQEGYLPHQQHDLYAVDITLEYSRPFRALKFWLAFRAHGAPASARLSSATLRRPGCCTTRSAGTTTSRRSARAARSSFRHVPPRVVDRNAHNAALAEALQADGRVHLASAPRRRGHLRPCFVNFRTTEEDVLALVEITREVGSALAGLERRA
jgi:aromatic-L-amino-acid decarboxylase